MCALKLDFLQSEKRANQKIHEEREKIAGKAARALKDFKISFGQAQQALGKGRIFKVITAKDHLF